MSEKNPQTKEPQYQVILDKERENGREKLGVVTGFAYRDDPKRLTFMLSRYKFVSKMLAGKDKVAEVGCGDAFSAPMVAAEVGSLFATDFDPVFVNDASERIGDIENLSFAVHNVLEGPIPNAPFDAAYACDVFEHIDPEQEDAFISNIAQSLTADGVLILGIPSLESQQYASSQSKIGHVNCKSGSDFKAVMSKHFKNVFLFSMNDEVVHTGYSPMAHYLFALCVGPKNPYS